MQRETQSRAEAALWAVLLLFLSGVVPPEARSAYVDYVYVDANEGQASGGHVGIAFGGQTFHFQYRDGGLILPQRHASGAFERVYRVHGNRNLRIHRIEVDDETYTLLRDGFNARYFESEVALAELRRLAGERSRLTTSADAEEPIVVPGAGFFYPDGDAPPRTDSAGPLARLYSRLAAEKFAFARNAERFGEADRLAERLSREALARGAVLRADTVFAPGDDALLLDEDSRAALEALLPQLEARIQALLISSRPDVGEARFLAMARYVAVSRSLAERRLFVLDAYPPEAQTISVAEVEARGGRLDELLAATRAELAAAKTKLHPGEAPDEVVLSRLEDAANRFREIRRAQREGGELRIVATRMIPQIPAYRTASGVSGLSANAREAALARNSAESEEILAELRAESSYNLVTRNCVSEIFRTLDELLAGRGTQAAAAQAFAKLGGHVAGSDALNFIPFVSADAVEKQYRVAKTVDLPSHRRRALEEIYAREGDGLAVYLREANTLTSTIYRRNAEDSIFLFFTDDIFAARPLYGALNLFAALGATVAGVPLLPFDGGELLAAGARGAFWSLPELAFVNVRKGSFFFVSPGKAVGSR